MNDHAAEIDTLIIRLGAAWRFDNEVEHAKALTELADLSRRVTHAERFAAIEEAA